MRVHDLPPNTLIVLTSDNGGLTHEREFNHDAVNCLRGSKGAVWEIFTTCPKQLTRNADSAPPPMRTQKGNSY